MAINPRGLTKETLEKLLASDDPDVAALASREMSFRLDMTIDNGPMPMPYKFHVCPQWWREPDMAMRVGRAVTALIKTGRTVRVQADCSPGINVSIYKADGQTLDELEREVYSLIEDAPA